MRARRARAGRAAPLSDGELRLAAEEIGGAAPQVSLVKGGRERWGAEKLQRLLGRERLENKSVHSPASAQASSLRAAAAARVRKGARKCAGPPSARGPCGTALRR